MRHSVLVVDDEVDNVEALERLFRRKYSVLKATSGTEALDLLRQNKVSLIVSDQRMPNMTGVEFLEASTKLQPEAIRILLTGFTDIESVVGAINSGQVYRYLTKPWDPVDLTNTIDKAIERYELSSELKEKNTVLEKALKELKVLDDAKSSFMILLNHELKTPLTVMLSYLELLQETKLEDEQKKYISRISLSADRLHNLIDDSLLLVQAETGLLKVEKSSVKLPKLLEDIAKTYNEPLQKRHMSLNFHLDVKDLKGDPGILKTVLQRLIDNAIKFGNEKSTIFVSSMEVGGKVRLSVINEGKALSKETIDKVLKPFTLDEDVMHHSKGTGLGLSVCQALLHRHDSQLEIECPKGKFEVRFSL